MRYYNVIHIVLWSRVGMSLRASWTKKPRTFFLPGTHICDHNINPRHTCVNEVNGGGNFVLVRKKNSNSLRVRASSFFLGRCGNHWNFVHFQQFSKNALLKIVHSFIRSSTRVSVKTFFPDNIFPLKLSIKYYIT